MKKYYLIIVRFLLLICTIYLGYITYLNLYPWLTGDFSAEINSCTFYVMLIWFILYCLMLREMSLEIVCPYQGGARTLVFIIPLGFMVMNILLEAVIWGIRTENDIQIDKRVILIKIAFMFFAFVLLGILFYVSMRNHIYIWYPTSLYCTIYAIPGADYASGLSGTGFVIVCLMGIVVLGIIEYGIMLYLNRKRWQKS